MSVGGLFGAGVSGLLASQRALATAGHNIANATTEGFTRQRVELAARPGQPRLNGFIGNGVAATDVRRIYDGFLVQGVRTATSNAAHLDRSSELLGQVDGLLASAGGGLAPAVRGFEESLHALATDPASLAAREVLLGEARALVGRFHALDAGLGGLETAVNREIGDLVGEINGLAADIASLNARIVAERGAAQDRAPNDLLDRRDELLRALAERVAITAFEQDDGSVTVAVGNGQALVVGARPLPLSVVPGRFDPSRVEIARGAGASAGTISSLLDGGRLGAVLEFREGALADARNALGRLALGLSESVNAQHRLGMDLDGMTGGDFFRSLSAEAGQVLAARDNSGSPPAELSVAIRDVAAMTDSDYRLERHGVEYTLTRVRDGEVVALAGFPAGAALIDGVEIRLEGGDLADGDAFLVRPAMAAARGIDLAVPGGRQIAAAAPVRSAVASGNVGAGEISAPVVETADPALLDPVTVRFDDPPVTFTVFGAVGGPLTAVPYASGAPLALNGWTVTLSGAPAPGDEFTVGPNLGGTGDNRNALALAGISAAPILADGTLRESYGQLVTGIGILAGQARSAGESGRIVLEQATAARLAVSGVNLDEEAADLLRFQQAFQASARVVAVASSVFESLLAAVSR